MRAASLTAAAAAAEWQFAPLVGFTFGGSSNSVFDPIASEAVGKRHWDVGGTVRLVGPGPLGVEALFLYVPGFFETDDPPPFLPEEESDTTITESQVVALMGNVVLTTPRAWNDTGCDRSCREASAWCMPPTTIWPFLQAGTCLGYNVGGGAVGMLSDRVGLRFDLRYFRHMPPGKESSPDAPDLPVFEGDRVRIHFWDRHHWGGVPVLKRGLSPFSGVSPFLGRQLQLRLALAGRFDRSAQGSALGNHYRRGGQLPFDLAGPLEQNASLPSASRRLSRPRGFPARSCPPRRQPRPTP